MQKRTRRDFRVGMPSSHVTLSLPHGDLQQQGLYEESYIN